MDKSKIIKYIRDEFETGKIRNNKFPMITKFGVRDYSETVHTMGLNYITEIGRNIEDISAISECPVYPYDFEVDENQMIAEKNDSYPKIKDEVRPDSIWFSKEDNSPILISEFERYEKSRAKDNKLKEKIQNLLISYHQLGGKVPIILFVYWSYVSVTPGDISEFISILDNGFRSMDGKLIHGINGTKTGYIVYHCIASGNKEKLTLNQWIKVR